MNRRLSCILLENVLVLKKSCLFCNVNTRELRAVSQVVEERFYKKGQYIIRQGEKGNSLYIIKSGQVQVSQISPQTGKLVNLKSLSSGAYFGEMAVIDEVSRTQTVISIGDCVVLKIKKDDLYEIIMEFPSIAIELLQKFVKAINEEKRHLEKMANE